YALSETSLHNGFSSSEFFDTNYNVFRKDRYEGTSFTAKGGGVLIAVNSRFICETVPLLDTSNIDCVCVKYLLNRSTNLFIHNAYIPPNSNPDLYAAHLKAINKLHSLSAESDIILVVGDFNIPKVEWEHDIDEFGEESSVMLPNCAHLDPSLNHTAEFIFDINELGMYQVNNIWREDHKDIPSNHILPHNMLDLVFTNDPDNVNVTKANQIFHKEGCHPPVFMTFEWNHESESTQSSSLLNFKGGDYETINRLLVNSDISYRLKDRFLSLENKVDLLMSTLYDAINQCVPRIERKIYPKCPWSTFKLRNLENIQSKAWKHYDRTKDKS
ncbi:MAG: hypothetical protein EOP45_21925, partial [Sphingobacteriaceae bacterium]